MLIVVIKSCMNQILLAASTPVLALVHSSTQIVTAWIFFTWKAGIDFGSVCMCVLSVCLQKI